MEVSGRPLDVHRLAVTVGDQVVGRRRPRCPLQHGVRVGDRLGVEDRAERHVVRHSRIAAIRVAHERVRHEPDPTRVHPRLGEEPGLDHRDEVRSIRLLRLEHDDGVGRVQQPVPVLADQRVTVGAPRRRDGERGALSQAPARLARLGGEHHLGAHVDRQHVGVTDPGAFRDAAHLFEVDRIEAFDRRLVRAGMVGHRGPVPARVRREDLAIRLDRATDAVARLLAIASTALPRTALDAHVWERHGTLAAISRHVVTHASGIASMWSMKDSSSSSRYGRPMICGCIVRMNAPPSLR